MARALRLDLGILPTFSFMCVPEDLRWADKIEVGVEVVYFGEVFEFAYRFGTSLQPPFTNTETFLPLLCDQ
jgi:hypothetical protein